MRQVYGRDFPWEMPPDNGRHAESNEPATEAGYETREVLLGSAVLPLGLFITFGLTLLYIG